MNKLQLFELLRATPGSGQLSLALATLLARWLICLGPLGLLVAWVRCDHPARLELLEMLLAIVLAWAAAQVIRQAWPWPGPFTLNLGTQYIQHPGGPVAPSEPVVVLWSLALAALPTRRFATWTYPLLAAGLAVGWSLIYLGLRFPLDILAALPLAVFGTAAARVLRPAALPASTRVLDYYDRLAEAVRAWRRAGPRA